MRSRVIAPVSNPLAIGEYVADLLRE